MFQHFSRAIFKTSSFKYTAARKKLPPKAMQTLGYGSMVNGI